MDGALERIGVAGLVVGGEFVRRVLLGILDEGKLLTAPLLNST